MKLLDCLARGPRSLPVVPWLVVPLLGMFLLAYPIRIVLASDLTPWWTVHALGRAAREACRSEMETTRSSVG